jgi:hypothetical protein
MLKQKYPDITAQRIKAIVSSRGKTWDKALGFGVPRWSMFSA